jgi:hypothetical protein
MQHFLGCENFAKNVKNKKGIFCLNKICQNFLKQKNKN